MPKISTKEWEALFKAADKNHSGFLEKDELMKLLKHANAQVSDSIVEKFFNFNEQQKISFENFVSSMKAMEDFLNKMTAFFNKFDSNKNGLLERAEFRKALEFAGRQYDDKEFETIFQKTDGNKNGKISLDEFLKTML